MKENIKKKKNKGNCKKKRILIIAFIILVVLYFNNKKEDTDISGESVQAVSYNVDNINEVSVFPTEVYGVPVHTQLIDVGTKSRPGTKRKIKYIVIHETDNFIKGTGAKNHASYLSENNTESTSWHYTVDDKEVYHHMPDNEIAYHAATDTGNLYGIGIELCVNEDGNFNKTFNNAVKLVAYLLKEYNLTVYDIKTHHDFSGKDCPHSILKNNRMDEFIEEVDRFL